MRRWCSWLTLSVFGTLAACASEPFPESLEGYATSDECVLLNLDAVPPDDEVPHPGYKSIYACHETPELFFDGETWVGPPYPDGTLIVKESCMDGANFHRGKVTGEPGGIPEGTVFARAQPVEVLRNT
mgnify:CR=1 FL=1